MSRQIELTQPIQKLLVGLDKAADAIGGTIGPKGKQVFYEYPPHYKITNDGKTVADAIDLSDPFEKAGAWLIKNTCAQQVDMVGDGSSTAAVLTQAIVHEALKRPENSTIVAQSLKDALHDVTGAIKKEAQPVKDILEVARISAEDEDLAKNIAALVEKVGADGTILIEENNEPKIDYEAVNGYEAQVGFMSPFFINKPDEAKAEYQNIHVFCSQRKINTVGDIEPLFKALKAENIRQLVVVAEELDPQILGIFVQNKAMGLFNILAIRATGPLLEDIAYATGAALIAESTGNTFEGVNMTHLGKCERVVSSEKKTIFVSKSKIAKVQAERLEAMASKNPNQFEAKKARERAAKLRKGIAVLRVGSYSTVEMGYLKDKADDAVHATQAALEQGVVEGGGMTLWRIASKMKPKTIGHAILKQALKAPLKRIVENAGKDYTEIVLGMGEHGYDAKNDRYVDMLAEGIIDPAKVEISAVTNATLNAARFISMHCAIIEEKHETQTSGK